MYFDDIVKQAKSPIQQQVFADKDEEMFVSIFKADGDDNDTGETLENPDDNGDEDNTNAGGNDDGDTGESLENPDDNAGAGNQGKDEGGNDDEGTGESLENPDEGEDQNDGDAGADQGGDNGTGESLENPGDGNQDAGSDDNGDQAGGQDQGAGETLENPNAAGGQDPNAQQQDPNQQQQSPEDEAESKIKDINERILLFRKHRKLEDVTEVLYSAVSGAIGQVVTVDARNKLLRIQKELLVTKGQIQYAISLDFKTIDKDKAEEIYKVLEKKVSLMSDTLKKIRKESAEA